MSLSPATSVPSFKEYDEAGISHEHWKIVLISGMGFFTDAYDLFIIGVVMTILKPLWHVGKLEVSLTESTALLASAIGAFAFGRVADILGRKRIYGVEVLVLAAGAIACACANSIWWMQAAGLIFGPLLATALLATHLSPNIVWRILIGFGAVPALAVFWQRRHLKETPRFEAARREAKQQTFMSGFATLVASRKLLLYLIGTSAAWFLMDAAYYGNTVSSPLVLSVLGGNHDLRHKLLSQLAIFVLFAAPGYGLAAGLMDRLGRKTIQCIGFLMMAATFSLLAFVPDLTHRAGAFLAVFGISFFFTEFGPNATTFVYPSEIFPVKVRTTSHGVAAAVGKLGGFVGTFLFPYLMHWKGLLGAESAAAAACVTGLAVTWFLLPEPKGRTLEELSD
ncbi:MAG TPA: MFS transporter [Opitutaceae bacterium]|jgi:MFS family permease